MKYIILNQKLMPESEAHISPQDRGFRYGDGVFETILVDGGKFYQWEFHAKRLKAALTATCIEFDTKILPALCDELIAANKMPISPPLERGVGRGNNNGLSSELLSPTPPNPVKGEEGEERNNCSEGLLRIQITRGIGGRGYLPEKGITPTLLIETMAILTPPPAPISLFLSSYEKISPLALPVNFKLCQGMNSTLARMEAADNNCFDALMLNDAGQICETSSANIFWLKNRVLYTPSLACGVVEGSIRNAVIRFSPYPVQEVAENLEVLAHAEAVFITNVAYKILPISALQPLDISWNSEGLAAEMLELLETDIKKVKT